jgi:hypothetical protein
MNPLNEIERATKEYAEARTELGDIVHELQRQMDEIKHPLIPTIKRAVAKTVDRYGKLTHLLEDHPELFAKPKTVIFHGVRVGYKKSKGGIEWDDEQRVISLIQKHYPEQADVLVKTTEKPVKKALEQLTAADLKKLGCTIIETGDEVYIQEIDSDVCKAVDALLASAIEEQEAA